MYGKIFDSIYDGTLVDHWEALITFEQMIILCDADGVFDMTPNALSRRTGIPLEIINRGIPILEQPDPLSRSPAESGKRIVRLDEHRTWGWYLVNHEIYRDLKDIEVIRAQNRTRKQRQRDRNRPLPFESRESQDGHALSRHTDTDTNTDTGNSKDRSKVPGSGDPGYRTKKGRMLTGEQLVCFNQFWTLFDKKDGKAEAADAWIDAKVTKRLLEDILYGAEQEAKNRVKLEQGGHTPKWAQGWLNGRRWEKWVELREQAGKRRPVGSTSAVSTEPKTIDWEAVGKKHGLLWDGSKEAYSHFIERVKITVRDKQ